MKSTVLKPLAVLTLTSFTMFGCASSNETSTAASDMTMSQTSAMAGMTPDDDDGKLNVLVVKEKVLVPVGTLSATALLMENPVEIDDMFDNIDETDNYTVYDLAKSSPNLSTFVQLIDRANLADDLKRVDELTLFAPTNEAFAKLPKEKLETLLRSDNIAYLSRVLQAHILATDAPTYRLKDNTRIDMAGDMYIPVNTTLAGTVISVGGAEIIKSDVEASNGTLHVVNNIILPSEDFREDDI